MKKNLLIYPLFASLFLLSACGCSGITKVTDAITNPSARELYVRELKNDIDVKSWESAYESAVNDSLIVTLPYGEKGRFNPATPIAYSYTVGLQEGEILDAQITQDVAQRTFLEVFEWDGNSFRSIGQTVGSRISAAGENAGLFKLVVQPEFGATGNFFVSINKKPLYEFPVSGKGNAAIQSFWGQVRDAGKRSHEGIDIFAKRGTPVVAVADGIVTRTGDHGIGGKQVWLRTGIFGKSVYYAHLDRIAVESATSVKVGDTLGFVGNTGNAKGGATHLHFGIYSDYGAVNPLSFVYRTDNIVARSFPMNFSSASLRIKSAKATLRQGPDTDFNKIGELKAGESVTFLGQTKDWIHVQTSVGQKAFLHKSLVKV
ncbi:MAG: M23 family peptidase [Flavobacterium sp.]|uniref:M23 family metallopeptidase n=1 Tax=Flavobacterium sp. TaxID=239 RepID=UPI00121795D3|nr:M23 family metallopeptidase [Flavobacterium sp.]RZJ65919.1 MAG: M23 family peptidase [Flavobacterium sp.]